MKFLVRDYQLERHERIRNFLKPETVVIAVLLAAVDLEWTIRRVLDQIACGDTELPDADKVSGLNGYAKAWSKLVKGQGAQRLQDVVGDDWDKLERAYQLRHDMVHGRQGSSGVEYVTKRVEIILGASRWVAAYGRERGADPYKRLRGKARLTH